MSEQTVAATESDRAIEFWEYHGVQFVNGETQHIWSFAGEELFFGKLKAPIVGAVYAVSVHRDATGKFIDVLKNPKFSKQIPDDERRRAIVAKSRVNETAAESWRMSKKENAEAIDGMTIEELRKKMRKYPTLQRRSMLALVVDRLLRGALV
jgi:hypothetical protein